MRLCAASGLTGVARPRHRSRYWDPADGGPHPASIKRIRECWNVKPTPRDKGLTLTVKVTAYDNGMVEVDGIPINVEPMYGRGHGTLTRNWSPA